MRTIFIILTSGFSARNILQTDIFPKLKTRDDLKLVFIVSPGTKHDFSELEIDNKIIFEEYEKIKGLESKIGHLRTLNSFSQPTTWKLDTETIKIRRAQWKKNKPLYYYCYRLASLIVSYDWINGILKFFDWKLFPKSNIDRIFKKYKPDLLFSTDPLFFDELYYLEYARSHNIKTVSIILSWDNLTARGVLPFLADNIIVWNKIQQQELMEIYGYKPENILISGIPQFDVYFNKDLLPSREEFFRQIGADINKKLIVYTTGSPTLLPGEDKLVTMAADDVINNKIKIPCQLLIRLNPRDSLETYPQLQNQEGIIFDCPGRPNRAFRDFWNPTKTDTIHLAATLKYADVILSMCSTISIEGAIFDAPLINLDINKKLSFFYQYTHFSRIVRSGGVRLVGNNEELIAWINNYLIDKSIDREGRSRIVDEQCYFKDGKSGERVADFIINNLD